MGDDIPRLGSIPLTTDETGSGAAFEMSAKAPWDADVELDQWAISVRRGSKAVVARTAGPTQGWVDALEMAQRGLDVACVRQKIETRIKGAEWTRIVWSSAGDQLGVDIVDLGRSHIHTGVATITAEQPDGTVVPPSEDRLSWDPHLRFFRYARTTTDLADAYRNSILALEAILSSQSPPRDREGERSWLVRALKEISNSGFDLAQHIPDGTADAVEHLVTGLYEKQRHPLFHAKVGRSVTLPSPSSSESDALIEALQTLMDLYLALVRYVHSVGRPTGHLFPAVFEGGAKNFVDKPICYTADDADIEDTSATSPNGLPVFELGRSVRRLDDDRYSMLFETTDIVTDAAIRRVCLTDDNGKPLFGTRLEELLVLPNATVLTVVCGIHFLNELDVRRRFST